MSKLRTTSQVQQAADIFKRCFVLSGLELTPEIEAQIEMACDLLYDSGVSASKQYPPGYRPRRER